MLPGKPERTFNGKDLIVLTGAVVKHPPASAGDVASIPRCVVATCSSKQTHSERQCRLWSAVYYASGLKAEPPLGQGPRPVFVKTLYIGEGNGNPLEYSCLENSMD